MLRSLPVSDPESLVVLNWRARATSAGQVRDERVWAVARMTVPRAERRRGYFPIPGSISPKAVLNIFSSVFAHLHTRQARKLNLYNQRTSRLARAGACSGGLLSWTWCSSGCGQADYSRWRPVGCAGGSGQIWVFSQVRFGGAANAVGQPILIDNLPSPWRVLRRRSSSASIPRRPGMFICLSTYCWARDNSLGFDPRLTSTGILLLDPGSADCVQASAT